MLDTAWGAATDTGRHRDHNEDSYLAAPGIFAVADGMGGHQAGEVASAIAIDVIRQLADRPDLTATDVEAAVAQAHDEIARQAAAQRSLAGMGTTLTGVAVIDVDGVEHWAVFNVGDSRVYRRQADTLIQVSIDHSEVEELVASGLIDREQAKTDFRRNIITRSLGGDVPAVPDLWVFPVVAGEEYLVCSDGLTNELSDEQILHLLVTEPSPAAAAQALVDAAVAAGGHDNVTAVVVATALGSTVHQGV